MKHAHVHLLSALAAELVRVGDQAPGEPLRLLDIGCGYGQLIRDATEVLPQLGLRDRSIELYGYEVYDHRAGVPNYGAELLAGMKQYLPSIAWEDRIRFGGAAEPWPFPDNFFAAAFSNQVLEHVEDLEFFFSQQRRVVGPSGVAVHFYPSREVLVEPHCGVPLAHRVSRRRRLSWLRGWSSVGIGKYRNYRRERATTLESFCQEFDGYLSRYVYFQSNKRIRSLATESGSEAGFAYGRSLLARGLKDSWELYRYPTASHLSCRSLFPFFLCNTLAQRFLERR